KTIHNLHQTSAIPLCNVNHLHVLCGTVSIVNLPVPCYSNSSVSCHHMFPIRCMQDPPAMYLSSSLFIHNSPSFDFVTEGLGPRLPLATVSDFAVPKVWSQD